mgnify:FL=1|jgi:hypothetical protein
MKKFQLFGAITLSSLLLVSCASDDSDTKKTTTPTPSETPISDDSKTADPIKNDINKPLVNFDFEETTGEDLYAKAVGKYTLKIRDNTLFTNQEIDTLIQVEVKADKSITINDNSGTTLLTYNLPSARNDIIPDNRIENGFWKLRANEESRTATTGFIELGFAKSGVIELKVQAPATLFPVHVADNYGLIANTFDFNNQDIGLPLLDKMVGTYPVKVWQTSQEGVDIGDSTFLVERVGEQGKLTIGNYAITTDEPNDISDLFGDLADVAASGFVPLAGAWRAVAAEVSGNRDSIYATFHNNGIIDGSFNPANGAASVQFSNSPKDYYGTTTPPQLLLDLAGEYSAMHVRGVSLSDNDEVPITVSITNDGTISFALDENTTKTYSWNGNGNYLTLTDDNHYKISYPDNAVLKYDNGNIRITINSGFSFPNIQFSK